MLIPKANVPDMKKVPEEITRGMKVIPVDHADQVLRLALELEKPEEFLVKSEFGALPVAAQPEEKPGAGRTSGGVRH